ncbi:hypothetical protein [Dendrosporobacter sp. 1207_IL3150]|uniref:hypothetical protein n=1 Tax=Dendrosporobacter sp. 1207_IL3150 TaxID=3084054 RepID=UPI002FD94E32
MKKTVITLAAFLAMNMGTGFAAPINDLSQGQTALGIGTDTFYIEHKLSDKFTLGFQNNDYDNIGDMEDIYGQFGLNSNLRGIIGSRNFSYDSEAYLGLAVNNAIAPQADGYASIIAGSSFKEFEIGTNVKLSHNTDLNLNYHNFMPDEGRDRNGVGVGATVKF